MGLWLRQSLESKFQAEVDSLRQKSVSLNRTDGRAGPVNVPLPIVVGIWLKFTVRSMTSPGRTTLLQ